MSTKINTKFNTKTSSSGIINKKEFSLLLYITTTELLPFIVSVSRRDLEQEDGNGLCYQEKHFTGSTGRNIQSLKCFGNRQQNEREELSRRDGSVPFNEEYIESWLSQQSGFSKASVSTRKEYEKTIKVKDEMELGYMNTDVKTPTTIIPSNLARPLKMKTDSANAKYFRLTEELLLADDYHAMGQHHKAWDPGGGINRPHTWPCKPGPLPSDLFRDRRFGSEDGDEYEDSSDGKSDVTVLCLKKSDFIGLGVGASAQYGLETFGDALIDEERSVHIPENVCYLSFIEQEERRKRLGDFEEAAFEDTPLNHTTDSVHTLDSFELDDMRQRYGFESFQRAEFDDTFLDDTLSSVHTLNSEDLHEMRRWYGFEDSGTMTPRSESPVGSLDAAGLEEIRERYGFEKSELNSQSIFREHLTYDDLGDKLTWYFQPSWRGITGDEYFKDEDSELITHDLLSEKDDIQNGYSYGMDILSEELNIVNSSAPEDTRYNTRAQWLKENFRGDQPKQDGRKEYHESLPDFPETPTIEELWAKWVDPIPAETNLLETFRNIERSHSNHVSEENILNRGSYEQTVSEDNEDGSLLVTNGEELEQDFQNPVPQNGNSTVSYDYPQEINKKSSQHPGKDAKNVALQVDSTFHLQEENTPEYQTSQMMHTSGLYKTFDSVDSKMEGNYSLNNLPDDSSFSADENKPSCVKALNDAIKDAVSSVACDTPRRHVQVSTIPYNPVDTPASAVVNKQKGVVQCKQVNCEFDDLQDVSHNVEGKSAMSCNRGDYPDQASVIQGNEERITSFDKDSVISFFKEECLFSTDELSEKMKLHQRETSTPQSSQTILPDVASSRKDSENLLYKENERSSILAASPNYNTMQIEEVPNANQSVANVSQVLNEISTLPETADVEKHSLTHLGIEDTKEVQNENENNNQESSPCTEVIKIVEKKVITSTSVCIESDLKEKNLEVHNQELHDDDTSVVAETKYLEGCSSSEITHTKKKEKVGQTDGENMSEENVHTEQNLLHVYEDRSQNEEQASQSRKVWIENEEKDDGRKISSTKQLETTDVDTSEQKQSICPKQMHVEETRQMAKDIMPEIITDNRHACEALPINECSETASNNDQTKEDVGLFQVNIVALNVAHEILTHMLLVKTSKRSDETKQPNVTQNHNLSTAIEQSMSTCDEIPFGTIPTELEIDKSMPKDFTGSKKIFKAAELDENSHEEGKCSKLCPSLDGNLLDNNDKVDDVSTLKPGEEEKRSHQNNDLFIEESRQDLFLPSLYVDNRDSIDHPSFLENVASIPVRSLPLTQEKPFDEVFVLSDPVDEDHANVCENVAENKTQMSFTLLDNKMIPVLDMASEKPFSEESISPDSDQVDARGIENTSEKHKLKGREQHDPVTISSQENINNGITSKIAGGPGTYVNPILELDTGSFSVDPSIEKQVSKTDVSGNHFLVYNMSNMEHIQSVSRRIVGHVLLSSLNHLHDTTPERHRDDRESFMVGENNKITSESPESQRGRSISNLASDNSFSNLSSTKKTKSISQDLISIAPNIEEQVSKTDATDNHLLVYNMSNMEHIQSVSRRIVEHVLSSSLNHLHGTAVERHRDDRESVMVGEDTEISSDFPENQREKNISPLASNNSFSNSNSTKETKSGSQKLIPQSSSTTNFVCAQNKNDQFRMEIDVENSFSETHFIHASSPRSPIEKESNGNLSGVISDDNFLHNIRDDEQDSGPLSLGDLQQPEDIDGKIDKPKDSAYYEVDLPNHIFVAEPNMKESEIENLTDNVEAEKEYCNSGGISLSPRYHYYNEGDSGFFDPCDSMASRDENELNFDLRGASLHSVEYRDDNNGAKPIRPKMRTADTNPSIKEEIGLHDSLCEKPSKCSASNLNPNTSLRPIVESTEDFTLFFKTLSTVVVGGDDTLDEAKDFLNKTNNGERDISSTSSESFCFREKVPGIKEDLNSPDNQAEFRRVRTGSSLHSNIDFQPADFSEDARTDLSQNINTSAWQTSSSQDIITGIKDSVAAQDRKTDRHQIDIIQCTVQRANTDIEIAVLSKDKNIDIELDDLEEATSSTHALRSGQGDNPNITLQKVETNQGTHKDIKESSVIHCTNVDVQPTVYVENTFFNASQTDDEQNILSEADRLLDPTQNSYTDHHQVQHNHDGHRVAQHHCLSVNSNTNVQSSFNPNPGSLLQSGDGSQISNSLFQQNAVPGDDVQMRESLATIAESLSLDPLSTGFLSPRLSSPRLTPRLTPRSRSNFERLRAMHRQVHGLSAEGLHPGNLDSGSEGQCSHSDGENPETEANRGEVAKQAAGGSRRERQESSCKFFTRVYTLDFSHKTKKKHIYNLKK